MEETGVLFQQGKYVVITISDYIKDGRVIDAYAVVNIKTGVAEYETRFLWDAIQWCKRCDSYVEKLLTEADNTLDWDKEDGPEDE